MLEHGGQLRRAAAQSGIPLAAWLDVSTGIAPRPYPVAQDIPGACWQRLPEEEDGLEDAARAYYGAAHLLPLPGSQAAIQTLPELRTPRAGHVVAVLQPAYGEYAPAWRAAGHTVRPFRAEALATTVAADEVDAVMLANPNNPDAHRFARADLLAAADRLRARNAWLIVDEAFLDAEANASAHSLATEAGTPGRENLIVLRSMGKFFGLAGLRVGFACGAPDLLAALRERIGPWAVSHPARHVARTALLDHTWQAAQRQHLQREGERLTSYLRQAGFSHPQSTALFCTVATPLAASYHQQLAQLGILARCFDAPSALRFGLPPDEDGWQRLARALAALQPQPETAP